MKMKAEKQLRKSMKQETASQKNFNKIGKYLATLTKIRVKMLIANTRNEREDIITEPTDIKG